MKIKLDLKRCECEHVCHTADAPRPLSPNGNPGHKYGARYALSYLRARKTPYGTFIMCMDCLQDCHIDTPGSFGPVVAGAR